jgi:beta-mannosidase
MSFGYVNHASLALLCGNNENETAIEHWNVPNQAVSKVFYRKQYLSIIPKILKKVAPFIEYWPSSPSSGTPFKNSNSDHYGDMHYWGVWHNNEPIHYYRHYRPRFMSEFGIQSFPALPTIQTFARPKDYNIFPTLWKNIKKTGQPMIKF